MFLLLSLSFFGDVIAMGKQAGAKAMLKRPAAKVQKSGSGTKKFTKLTLQKLLAPKVDTLFDQHSYVKQVASMLNIEASKTAAPLHLPWASAFDGSNMPGEVMRVIKAGLSVRPQQVCGISAASHVPGLMFGLITCILERSRDPSARCVALRQKLWPNTLVRGWDVAFSSGC